MKSSRLLFVLLLIPLLGMIGCTGDTGPAGPSGTQSCAECHNATNLITGKMNQWAESRHGTGEAYLRGTSSSCAGCHSGNAFRERIAAGLQPDELTEGDIDPTRQDCRACHMIHESYTAADFAVRGTSAVQLYAVDGATFDGGLGNLCVNCHQPRRVFPEPVGGVVTGITSHWGPHHGPQSAMLLGMAGAGDVQGTPHPHYAQVTNVCVHCHMGDEREHYFEPDVGRCQSCHTSLVDFNYHNVQSDVDSLANELGSRLLTAGLINENSPDGHPIVTEAPEDQAVALWNWVYVAHEDKSHGVHNAPYAKALLEEGIARMP